MRVCVYVVDRVHCDHFMVSGFLRLTWRPFFGICTTYFYRTDSCLSHDAPNSPLEGSDAYGDARHYYTPPGTGVTWWYITWTYTQTRSPSTLTHETPDRSVRHARLVLLVDDLLYEGREKHWSRSFLTTELFCYVYHRWHCVDII